MYICVLVLEIGLSKEILLPNISHNKNIFFVTKHVENGAKCVQ